MDKIKLSFIMIPLFNTRTTVARFRVLVLVLVHIGHYPGIGELGKAWSPVSPLSILFCQIIYG